MARSKHLSSATCGVCVGRRTRYPHSRARILRLRAYIEQILHPVCAKTASRGQAVREADCTGDSNKGSVQNAHLGGLIEQNRESIHKNKVNWNVVLLFWLKRNIVVKSQFPFQTNSLKSQQCLYDCVIHYFFEI